MDGNNSSITPVIINENIIDTKNEVEIKLSAFLCSFAPITCESKIDIPFVAPIAIDVRVKIIGVEVVSTAIAVSPNKLPIHILSTRLYAMFKNIATINGKDIFVIHFFYPL